MSETPTKPPVEPLPDAAETASTRETPADSSHDTGAESEAQVEAKQAENDDDFDMDTELHRLKKHRRGAPAEETAVPEESNAEPAAESKERRRPVRRANQESKNELDAAAARRRRDQQRKGRAVSKPANSGEAENGENSAENRDQDHDLPADQLEESEEEDEATRERKALEARIDAVLQPSSKRRKHLAGDDLEAMQDEVIAQLRDTMREAALKDVECIQNGEPAVNKIKMLPEVVHVLQKQALADSILDGNLLESMRIWLEPLPDASLPSFEIQKALFAALVRLPIKTIHLRESGLGRVVLFYQKSKRPQPVIKRMAQKLIGDWTRPIIGRSDNYRDKRVATASFDPEAFSQDAAKAGLASAQQSRSREPMSSYEESAARRGRAAIPSASGVSYQVAPLSSGATYNESAQAQGSSRDSQLRRMKAKLMTSGRSGRKKSQVSVEGRGLN